MSLMKWSDRLLVGVEQLDAEHRQLLSLCNEVHDAALARASRERVDALLSALIDLTERHVEREAASMEAVGYPRASRHLKEHTLLVAKEMELRIRNERGEPLTQEILGIFRDWLFDHIVTEDRALGDFVRAVERKRPTPLKLSA